MEAAGPSYHVLIVAKQGPSECDKVSKCITHIVEEKGRDSSNFLEQEALLVCPVFPILESLMTSAHI